MSMRCRWAGVRGWWLVLATIMAAVAAQAVPITYTLPEAARVSLAVTDSRGMLVRTLLSAAPQSKGRHTVQWDGLDVNGMPAPAGSYQWKVLTTQGLHAEYLTSLGTSFGYHHWVGNHGGPGTLACDGGRIVTAGFSEVPPMIGSISLAGDYQWGVATIEPAHGVSHLALDGTQVHALLGSGNLYTLQAADGKRLSSLPLQLPVKSLGAVEPFTDKEKTITWDVPNGAYILRLKAGQTAAPNAPCYAQVQQWGTDFPALKAGEYKTGWAPLVYGGMYPISVSDGKLALRLINRAPGQAVGIAEVELLTPASTFDIRDGELVAVFASQNIVAWVDAKTGVTTTRAAVPAPLELVITAPGQCLVLTADRVLRVTREHPAPEEVVTGLHDATHLAVDRVTGEILVAGGRKSQQVRRFSATGTQLKAYGRPGGRLEGAYEPRDFQAISGVASDGQGGFVVTEYESAPRRTAHFAADGTLIREWYGGQLYFTYMAFDPADPTVVWFDSHWGWLVQAKVDYAKKTWRVLATYRSGDLRDGLTYMKGNNPGGWEVRHYQGQTYLVLQHLEPTIVRVDEAGRQLVPVMTTRGQFNHYWSVQPKAFQAIRGGQPRRDGPQFFSWCDRNGDGAMQAEEIAYANWATWNPRAWWVDDRLTIHMAWLPEGAGTHTAVTWQPKEWINGVPCFDTLDAAPRRQLPAVPGGVVDLRREADGSTILLLRGGGDGYTADGTYGMAHNSSWPANLSDRAVVVRLNAQDQMLWQVGVYGSDATQRTPGHLEQPMRIAGFVHGCVGVAERIMEPCGMWTRDGLYVGSVLDQIDTKAAPAHVYAWWRGDASKPDDFETNLSPINYDMLMGGDLAELPNGDVIFAAAGWNSVPLFRITGWQQFKRLQGTLKLGSAAAAPAGTGTGLAGEYYANETLSGDPVRQTDARLWFDRRPNSKHAWPLPEVTAKSFSGRWNALVEPRFSEAYTFAVYTGTGGVRLWVGGKLVADTWASQAPKAFSSPIPLTAGVKAPLRLEWRQVSDRSELHLCWESATQSVEHVPTTALYPVDTRSWPLVTLRTTSPVSSPLHPAEVQVMRDGDPARALAVRLGTDMFVPGQTIPFVIPGGQNSATFRLKNPPHESISQQVVHVSLEPGDGYRSEAGSVTCILEAMARGPVWFEGFDEPQISPAWTLAPGTTAILAARTAADTALRVAGDSAAATRKFAQPVAGDFFLAMDLSCDSDKMYPLQLLDAASKPLISIYCHNAANSTTFTPGQKQLPGFQEATVRRWTHLTLLRSGSQVSLSVSGKGEPRRWVLDEMPTQPVGGISLAVAWGQALWDNLCLVPLSAPRE